MSVHERKIPVNRYVTAFLRRAAAFALCGLLLLGTAPAFAASAKRLNVSFSVVTYQNRARDLLKQLNSYRRQNGLSALTMTADLESAALQRAAELFVFFDHDRPDLTEYDTILADYSSLSGTLSVAECVTAGWSKAADALDAWKDEGQELLLDEDFTHAGIACVYMKDSLNEYYWALLLSGQPEDFQGKAAAASASAGKTKTMRVEISPDMFERADNSHKRFELRANDLNLKGKSSATPTVNLYDRYDVKIGKCAPESLSYRSSNTSVFTVSSEGLVKKKKAGSGTLTVSFTGLESLKIAVNTSASSSGGSSSGGSVTASTIKEYQPELSVKETSKAYTLSVKVKGASGYVLYRSSSKSGSYTKVDEKATTDRWDYRLEKEDLSKSYYYKVRAYKNSNGKRVYSEYSEPVRLVP